MQKIKTNILKLVLAILMLITQSNVATLIAYANLESTVADSGYLVGEESPEEQFETEAEITVNHEDEQIIEEETIKSEDEQIMEKEEEASVEIEDDQMIEAEEETSVELEDEGIIEQEIERITTYTEVIGRSLRSLSDLNIVVDPGHGGHDPGAVAMHNNVLVTESELVLDISLRLQALLEQTGMNVSMTRTTDVFIPLLERSNFANRLGADLFVSVHMNSFTNTTANGTETYYFSAGGGLRAINERVNSSQHHGMDTSAIERSTSSREQDSRLLAEKIQARLLEKLQLTDRGVRQGNFSVIRETNMAAVLAELGFISNERDRTLLESNRGRDLAAQGLYLGILDYLVAQGFQVPEYLFNLNSSGPTLIRQGQTIPNTLNVRRGNSTAHGIITTLPAGTRVNIIGESNGWFRIEVGNITGWVSGDLVELTEMGWRQIGGNWFYYANGNRVTGWRQINGNWHHFRTDGAMETGWVASGGNWFFMNGSGVMETGWVLSGGDWYFMNASGVMETGWVSTGGNWYFMDTSGVMQTGWIASGGNWFFMNTSGVMQTSWVSLGGDWYFMDTSGVLQTGWVATGGEWYFMNGSGVMQVGRIQINGQWHHFNSNGIWMGQE